MFRDQDRKHPGKESPVDLIAEFCLIFILLKISANFVCLVIILFIKFIIKIADVFYHKKDQIKPAENFF